MGRWEKEGTVTCGEAKSECFIAGIQTKKKSQVHIQRKGQEYVTVSGAEAEQGKQREMLWHRRHVHVTSRKPGVLAGEYPQLKPTGEKKLTRLKLSLMECGTEVKALEKIKFLNIHRRDM